jgi:tRNA threonylcarbamoyladenosine biosynthesis protein TsaB
VIVLGFDTATRATAVALRLADGRTTQARDDPRPGDHPGHATRLLAMIGDLLAGAGIRWSGIDRIAVGVGPGTFTGLRVGIATARGLAQSLSVELIGVSSLQALAAAAFTADVPRVDGLHPDAVLAVIDARRGEAFAAAYEPGDGGAPAELTIPRALAPEDLASVLAQAEETGGGQARRWLAVGDGAIRFRSHLGLAGVRTPIDGSQLHRVSAAAICELGERAAAVASYQEIVPDYRRRPDAEIALEAAGTGRGSEP